MKKLVHQRKTKILQISDFELIIENIRQDKILKGTIGDDAKVTVDKQIKERDTEDYLNNLTEFSKLKSSVSSLLEEEVDKNVLLNDINAKVDTFLINLLDKVQYISIKEEVITLASKYSFYTIYSVCQILKTKLEKDVKSLEKGCFTSKSYSKFIEIGDNNSKEGSLLVLNSSQVTTVYIKRQLDCLYKYIKETYKIKQAINNVYEQSKISN